VLQIEPPFNNTTIFKTSVYSQSCRQEKLSLKIVNGCRATTAD